MHKLKLKESFRGAFHMYPMNNQRQTHYGNMQNDYYNANEALVTPEIAKRTQTPFEYFQKPPLPEELFQNTIQKKETKETKETILSHFQDENGGYNFDKIIQTTNQAVHVFKQASPIFYQLTAFVTDFKR